MKSIIGRLNSGISMQQLVRLLDELRTEIIGSELRRNGAHHEGNLREYWTCDGRIAGLMTAIELIEAKKANEHALHITQGDERTNENANQPVPPAAPDLCWDAGAGTKSKVLK